jgi:hypothetical protein
LCVGTIPLSDRIANLHVGMRPTPGMCQRATRAARAIGYDADILRVVRAFQLVTRCDIRSSEWIA